MSDLSRLLDDVYRSASPAPAPAPIPAWSSDAALDEAFADWVPAGDAAAPPETGEVDQVDEVDEVDVTPEADRRVEVDPIDALFDVAMHRAGTAVPVTDDADRTPSPTRSDLVELAALADLAAPVAPPAPSPDLAALLAEVTPLADWRPRPEPTPLADLTAPVAPVAPVPEPEPVLVPEPEPVVRAPAPAPAPAPQPPHVWSIADDDILPPKAARRRFSLRGR